MIALLAKYKDEIKIVRHWFQGIAELRVGEVFLIPQSSLKSLIVLHLELYMTVGEKVFCINTNENTSFIYITREK